MISHKYRSSLFCKSTFLKRFYGKTSFVGRRGLKATLDIHRSSNCKAANLVLDEDREDDKYNRSKQLYLASYRPTMTRLKTVEVTEYMRLPRIGKTDAIWNYARKRRNSELPQKRVRLMI